MHPVDDSIWRHRKKSVGNGSGARAFSAGYDTMLRSGHWATTLTLILLLAVDRRLIALMLVLAAYLILGAIAGTLSGLFGIGGGLVIVPALVFGFGLQGVSPEIAVHLAVGTSLATIIFTSISSVRAHHSRGAVRIDLFWPMAAGIVIGTAIGVNTAVALSGETLKMIIGIFAIGVAFQMGFGLKPKPSRDVPGKAGLTLVGGGIGWASALFGIGGGTLTVPFLSWCNVRIQQVVGTSAACGLPIAISGALTNAWAGWGHPDLPAWSTGFVYWPALVGIALTRMYFAKFGVRLAHNMKPEVLKRSFAVLLVIVGLRFLWSAWA